MNPLPQWRDVVGYEGRYEVSDVGAVRNAQTGRVLKPLRYTNGYVGVTLCHGVGRRFPRRQIHRLVALAFLPNSEGRREVNHKNGIRTDNRLVNLEWTTTSENRNHANQNLSPKPHKAIRAVIITNERETVRYPSLSAAARAIGVHDASTSSAARHGHRCKGYVVQYA